MQYDNSSTDSLVMHRGTGCGKPARPDLWGLGKMGDVSLFPFYPEITLDGSL